MTAQYPDMAAGAPGLSHRVSRRAQLNGPGQLFELVTRELQPAEPGGAIVILQFAGVCGSDVHVWRGERDFGWPIVLGHEGVGKLAEIGEGPATDYAGEPVEIGDRVYVAPQKPCHRCHACTVRGEFAACVGREDYFWRSSAAALSPATYNDHIYLQAGAPFFKIPDDVPSLAVIAFGCALPTMLQAYERAGGIRLGETVLVQGCGPVGLAATVIARASGAQRVVVVGAPEHRLDMALRLGADEVVNLVELPDIARRAAALRHHLPDGADLVVEAAGVTEAFFEGLDLVSDGGRYLIVGLHYGSGAREFDPRRVNNRNLTLYGSALEQPVHQFKALRFVQRHHTAFPIAEVVTHRYPLERANDALSAMATGDAIKAVVVPSPAG